MVQKAPAARAPPLKVKPSLVPLAVTVAPTQVVVGAEVISRPWVLDVSPSICASVSASLVSKLIVLVGLALVNLMAKDEAWPAATVVRAKVLVTCSTERIESESVALAVACSPRWLAKSVALLIVLTTSFE